MFHGLELLASKNYEIDLSNEVLNIDFGQGATKISGEVEKKIADSARFKPIHPRTAKSADIFFDL